MISWRRLKVGDAGAEVRDRALRRRILRIRSARQKDLCNTPSEIVDPDCDRLNDFWKAFLFQRHIPHDTRVALSGPGRRPAQVVSVDVLDALVLERMKGADGAFDDPEPAGDLPSGASSWILPGAAEISAASGA